MPIHCASSGSVDYYLAGKINGKQRYRCKGCNHHYILDDRRRKYVDAQHYYFVKV